MRSPNLSTFYEYLEQEKSSSSRHEYVSGYWFEIPEIGEEHNLITGNITTRLHTPLKKSDCRVFTSDMKLWIEAADVCYYPDLMVVCDSQDSDRYFKTSPCLIIEIFSPSTSGTDRGEKWLAYQKLPSLQEYVLVSETELKIEVYRKNNLGDWGFQSLKADNQLRFESLGISMMLTEVYEYVFTGEGNDFI